MYVQELVKHCRVIADLVDITAVSKGVFTPMHHICDLNNNLQPSHEYVWLDCWQATFPACPETASHYDISVFLDVKMKELLVGLSAEGKREMTSFMGSVNAKTRDILQVNGKRGKLLLAHRSRTETGV